MDPVKRTVAIILGDNDFGNTFKPLLESLYRIWEYSSGEFDKEQLRQAILAGTEFHYRAFQLIPYRPKQYDPEKIERTVKYLKTNLLVLYDEEAEFDIQTKDYDGGAWYLELRTGKVYPY